MSNFYIAEIDSGYLSFKEFGKKRPFLLAFSAKGKLDTYLQAHDFTKCNILAVDLNQLVYLAMSAGLDIVFDRCLNENEHCLHIDIGQMEKDIQQRETN